MELFGDGELVAAAWLDRIIPKVSIERVPDAVAEAPATVVVAEDNTRGRDGGQAPGVQEEGEPTEAEDLGPERRTRPNRRHRVVRAEEDAAKKPARKSSPRT